MDVTEKRESGGIPECGAEQGADRICYVCGGRHNANGELCTVCAGLIRSGMVSACVGGKAC